MGSWAIRFVFAMSFWAMFYVDPSAQAMAGPLWQETEEEDPIREGDEETPGTYSGDESDRSTVGFETATDLELQSAREVYNDVTDPIEIGSRRLGRITPLPREVFRLGSFTIFPELREEVIWNSNIFLTERQVKSSWLFRHILGGYSYGEFADERIRLDLGYQVEFNNFTRNPVRIPSGDGRFVTAPRDIDHSQQFANARLRFDYNRVFASLQWKYENLFDPIRIDLENPNPTPGNTPPGSAPLSPFVFNGEDLRRNLVLAEGRFGAYLDEDRIVTVEGRYQFLSSQYNAPQLAFFDSQQHRFSARGSYRIASRHAVYGEFVYGVWDYGRPRVEARRLNDDIYREYAAGFQGEVQDNVTYEARVAYRYDNFEEDSALGFAEENIGSGSSDNKHRDLIGTFSITAAPTDELTVSARYLRAMVASPNSNFQVINRLDSYVLYDFTQELAGKVGAFYEHSSPSSANRLSRWGTGIGALYRLTPNVQIGLDWEYRQRISSDPFGDYRRHLVALSLGLSF